MKATKMKIALLALGMTLSSVANAGLFSTEKSKKCWEKLKRMPGANVIYTCEFGKIVAVRESRGNDRNNDRGGRGGHGGCKNGRN